MQLPQHVRRAIDERAEAVGFATLKRAATAMSEAYRERRIARLPDVERVAAYLVTRMPATYAAAHAVLSEVRRRLGQGSVSSVLDLGAGAGAASLAARAWFPEAAITMVERDGALAEVARQFLPDTEVRITDVRGFSTEHDLIIAAYSLGEIGEPMGKRLWQMARVALVAIEPGTTRGFGLIRGIRDELLHDGAHMVAPCPVETPCPIVDPDWCHFAARVERSSIHRRVKDAELGYEDEKYSYVALARKSVELPRARIIRRPRHQPGLIVLDTCTAGGLRTERVTKRDREAFRAARKRSWGDEWGTVS